MQEADCRFVSDASLRADLELLYGKAAEAGRIAQGYFRNSPEVWYKDGKSPVSEADLAVDRYLKSELLAARPDIGWVSEESAQAPGADRSGRYFIVDPIDGTRAFLKGKETWCVSVALVADGRPIAAVLNCPAKDEVYLAASGHGARLNGRTIRVARADGKSTVAGPAAMIDALPDKMRQAINRHGYIPSLAYRIAMVANGAIDATFVRPNAHDWDIAAADLLLKEAGGTIRLSDGRQPDYLVPGVRLGAMVAGSGTLLDQLHDTIRTSAATG